MPKNVSDIFTNTGFKVFADVLAAKGAIYAVLGKGGAALSRGQIDKLTDLVKKNGAKGLVSAYGGNGASTFRSGVTVGF